MLIFVNILYKYPIITSQVIISNCTNFEITKRLRYSKYGLIHVYSKTLLNFI